MVVSSIVSITENGMEELLIIDDDVLLNVNSYVNFSSVTHYIEKHCIEYQTRELC